MTSVNACVPFNSFETNDIILYVCIIFIQFYPKRYRTKNHALMIYIYQSIGELFPDQFKHRNSNILSHATKMQVNRRRLSCDDDNDRSLQFRFHNLLSAFLK